MTAIVNLAQIALGCPSYLMIKKILELSIILVSNFLRLSLLSHDKKDIRAVHNTGLKFVETDPFILWFKRYWSSP